MNDMKIHIRLMRVILLLFLTFHKEHNNSYSTLQQSIQAFSSYFKTHDLDNTVLSINFKIFKSGIRREMCGGYFSNAKNHLIHRVLI